MTNLKPMPLYRRCFDSLPATHFYTTDKAEADAAGGRDEGIACYVYPTQVDGTVPLYRRCFDSLPARHFYTTNKAEADAAGGRDEGIACYVIPTPTWTFKFQDIEYGEAKIPNTTKDVLKTQKVKNLCGKAPLTETVTCSDTRSSTFEWGLEQTLEVGVELEFEAGIPMIAATKATASVKLGLGSHQTWSETKSFEYSVTTVAVAEPGENVIVTGWVDWVDGIEIPFKLQCLTSATRDEVPITGDDLKDLFQKFYPDYKVTSSPRANEIVVSLDGKLTGSYGVSTGASKTQDPDSIVSN